VEGGKEALARFDAFVVATGRQAFVISRSFDAPCALLWKALTEPERMAKWWGRRAFRSLAPKWISGSEIALRKFPKRRR